MVVCLVNGGKLVDQYNNYGNDTLIDQSVFFPSSR